MRRINTLQTQIDGWESLRSQIMDLSELYVLAEEEEPELALEISNQISEQVHSVEKMELELLLDGPYDEDDCMLAIHAGTGGVDAQDWAEMLLRMYTRWSERRNFEVSLLDVTEGDEAGIKSATLELRGPYAFGYASAEAGTHRLVRLSPFDSNNRRHTSFALVEVLPVVDEDIDIEIREEDIRVDTYRASGAGGQHVNKTSSAVRITHLPTGIVATCQNERSQLQNRATAMKILRSRLVELKLREREAEQAAIKGKPVIEGWGNRIRSYVLQPYTMVTDHRTGYSTGNVQAILDGDLDQLIDAYLHQQMEENQRITQVE